MRDTELYERVLGLSEPWLVGEVVLQVEVKRVDAWVEHPPGERRPIQCYPRRFLKDQKKQRTQTPSALVAPPLELGPSAPESEGTGLRLCRALPSLSSPRRHALAITPRVGRPR